MAHLHRKIILSFLLLSSLGCVSQTPKSVSATPPNVAILKKPFDEAWKLVISTVAIKHMMPLEVNEPKQGTFATKRMVEENTLLPTRYRLTGTVIPSQEGVIVTLYKQQEILDKGYWKAVQSSYELERNLLKEIQGHP